MRCFDESGSKAMRNFFLVLLVLGIFLLSFTASCVSCNDDEEDPVLGHPPIPGQWSFSFSGNYDGGGDFEILGNSSQVEGAGICEFGEGQQIEFSLSGAMDGLDLECDMLGTLPGGDAFVGEFKGILKERDGTGEFTIPLSDEQEMKGAWDAWRE